MKRTLLGLFAGFAVLAGLLVAAPAATVAAAQPAAADPCPSADRHVWRPTKVFVGNECYRTPGGVLVMQTDGNLVIYDNNWNPICHANTWGHPGAVAVFQNDGNFVIYIGRTALAWSGTAGHPDATLIFGAGAQLRIRDASGLLWNMCVDGFHYR